MQNLAPDEPNGNGNGHNSLESHFEQLGQEIDLRTLLKSKSVTRLRQLLEVYGLPTNGNKATLIDRCVEAQIAPEED